MKLVKYISIATLALMFAGCAKDAPTEETVEVCFKAVMPQQAMTKAGNSAVNKVVCTVYSNGAEIEGLRKTVDIIDGQEIVYTPRLIRNQTYKILFWAMQDDSYAVENMTAIKRNTSLDAAESDYDAFSACVEHTTNGTAPDPVKLTRPLARINLGVAASDWEQSKNIGLTPSKVELTVDAYQTYNVLDQAVTGEAVLQTFTIPVPDEEIAVENKIYKKLSSNYMFIGTENVSLTYKIYGRKADGDTDVEITSRTISNLPVKQNFNTNLVGNLLTEEVSFKIILEDAFGNDSDAQTIE